MDTEYDGINKMWEKNDIVQDYKDGKITEDQANKELEKIHGDCFSWPTIDFYG